MKAISLKTQQRLMHIPLINAVNLFICVYNLHAVPIDRRNESKSLLYLFAYTMPAGLAYSILYRICSALIPILEPLVYAAGIYLIPLVMSYGLIQFQKKYMFADTESKEENLK